MLGVERGQIVFCNILFETEKGVSVFLEKCIFSNNYQNERIKLFYNDQFDRLLINKTKLKENLNIKEIEIIQKVGFRNKNKINYTLVKKSEKNERTKDGVYI